MENNMMNGELLTTEEVIMEELNRQLEDIESNIQEDEEKKNSGLGVLIGGLVVTGALVATGYAMKHPKVKSIRRNFALSRARKMNEMLGLNISDEDLVSVINAKYDCNDEIVIVEEQEENE